MKWRPDQTLWSVISQILYGIRTSPEQWIQASSIIWNGLSCSVRLLSVFLSYLRCVFKDILLSLQKGTLSLPLLILWLDFKWDQMAFCSWKLLPMITCAFFIEVNIFSCCRWLMSHLADYGFGFWEQRDMKCYGHKGEAPVSIIKYIKEAPLSPPSPPGERTPENVFAFWIILTGAVWATLISLRFAMPLCCPLRFSVRWGL